MLPLTLETGMLHPSDPGINGRYFENIKELRGADGRIMKIKDDPTPIGVARDSVWLCWTCEDEIALASDDFREVILWHPQERGPSMSRARFCSRACWEEWAMIGRNN